MTVIHKHGLSCSTPSVTQKKLITRSGRTLNSSFSTSQSHNTITDYKYPQQKNSDTHVCCFYDINLSPFPLLSWGRHTHTRCTAAFSHTSSSNLASICIQMLLLLHNVDLVQSSTGVPEVCRAAAYLATVFPLFVQSARSHGSGRSLASAVSSISMPIRP